MCNGSMVKLPGENLYQQKQFFEQKYVRPTQASPLQLWPPPENKGWRPVIEHLRILGVCPMAFGFNFREFLSKHGWSIAQALASDNVLNSQRSGLRTNEVDIQLANSPDELSRRREDHRVNLFHGSLPMLFLESLINQQWTAGEISHLKGIPLTFSLARYSYCKRRLIN